MNTPFAIEEELAFASRLADAAWTKIQPHFRVQGTILNKLDGAPGDFDPVTEGDKGAERMMRALIEQERPGYGIIGEEFGTKPSENGFSWVLDPIDGTRAFVAGLPVWTTLIALCAPDGTPILGVIDQPVLDERYIGWPGAAIVEKSGARSPLKVSACTDLRQSVIATTDPFLFTPSEQGAWHHLRATARISRYGLDAYAYARLSAGSIDLVAESGLQAWDVAALIPVVTGAGGLATDWRGNPAKAGGQIVCAASEGILEQALLALRRSADVR